MIQRPISRVLITGGAGFIGNNFIRYLFSRKEFTGTIINLDLLTYAGNPESVSDIETEYGGERYFFERGDICERTTVERAFDEYGIDTVVHFAAESHVDRSIIGPEVFIRTNVLGTFTLLDVARQKWGNRKDILFHHISTDEVYGSLGDSGRFVESTPYDPMSPYSASKASSDHLAMAYSHTYRLPVTLSNCSNNYGPYQFPEKLIPLMILNMLEGKPLPVYGDGQNVRDWLYVEDHNSAIWEILRKGRLGERYNIGGDNEWKNLELVNVLCEKVALTNGKQKDEYKALIKFVNDRPGHDRRYAIDCSKIKTEMGWKQSVNFDEGLEKTVRWYLTHKDWTARVRSGEYKNWIEANYGSR